MNDEPSEDLQLFERWRSGDARAGNLLFERHFDAIYRFFLHKVDGDAVDLVQRTFLACVEARERFEARSSFRTYLFAIARHELLAHWRRARKAVHDPAGSSILELSPSPSSAMLQRHEHRLLLEALRSIPLDLQIAIELHYWEGLSTTEIAEVLDIPAGTVKSRLRRAREALIEALERLEDDPEKLRTTLADLDGWAVSLKQALLEDRPSVVSSP